MVVKVKKTVKRVYIFSQKELKDALELTGDIDKMELWKGRSPNQIDAGVSSDTEEWAITTIEGGEI